MRSAVGHVLKRIPCRGGRLDSKTSVDAPPGTYSTQSNH